MALVVTLLVLVDTFANAVVRTLKVARISGGVGEGWWSCTGGSATVGD